VLLNGSIPGGETSEQTASALRWRSDSVSCANFVISALPVRRKATIEASAAAT
jgi:hypothetical protein